MHRIIFVQQIRATSDQTEQALGSGLAAIAGELHAVLECCDNTQDLRAALERDPRGAVLAVIIAADVKQTVQIARLVHRLDQNCFLELIATPPEESALLRRLGIAPMIGTYWAFAPPEEEPIRRILSRAKRTSEQRRSVQTTIRRAGRALAVPVQRVETRFRREMLAEHYFSSLLTHGFDAVICFGSDQQVLVWNAAAERILGRNEATIAGRTIDDLVGDDVLQPVLAVVRNAYEEICVQRRELRYVHPGGSTVYLEVTVTPVRDDTGGTMGLVLIARDVTERLRAEYEALAARDEAERANRAKDRFLAVLSHELRTPLTPALALLDSLTQREELPIDMRSDLQLIRRNVLMEAHLVNDLLDISRISKGKLQLHTENCDVHRLLDYAQETCRPDAAAKSIRLEAEYLAASHHMSGDLTRVQQVFWNLLQNAVKFTPAGGLVTIRTENPSSDRIEVSVRDNGVGIDPDVLSNIFDPFEQGTTAVTRQFGGLGLGLAICKALVEAHGGSIAVASAGRGQGATFTVTLQTTSESDTRRTVKPAPRETHESLRILLVEDHDDTRGTLQRLLTRRGHVVHTAATVAGAVRAANDCQFDLLITDIGLPDATGHDLMRQIRQLCPKICGIALSGFGTDEDIAASMEAGFSQHLTKPVNFQKLEETISQWGGIS